MEELLEIVDYIIKENISGRELLKVSIIKYLSPAIIVLKYDLAKDSTEREERLIDNLIINKEHGGSINSVAVFLETFNTEFFTILKIEQDEINLNN